MPAALRHHRHDLVHLVYQHVPAPGALPIIPQRIALKRRLLQHERQPPRLAS
jgi:hypothetical protein